MKTLEKIQGKFMIHDAFYELVSVDKVMYVDKNVDAIDDMYIRDLFMYKKVF